MLSMKNSKSDYYTGSGRFRKGNSNKTSLSRTTKKQQRKSPRAPRTPRAPRETDRKAGEKQMRPENPVSVCSLVLPSWNLCPLLGALGVLGALGDWLCFFRVIRGEVVLNSGRPCGLGE